MLSLHGGQKDGVDHMDHAVGLLHIGDGDGGDVALTVLDLDGVAFSAPKRFYGASLSISRIASTGFSPRQLLVTCFIKCEK